MMNDFPTVPPVLAIKILFLSSLYLSMSCTGIKQCGTEDQFTLLFCISVIRSNLALPLIDADAVYPYWINETSEETLHQVHESGISNGISSSMHLSSFPSMVSYQCPSRRWISETFLSFLIFPSLMSLCFSALILFTSSSAGSSLGSWGTNLPWTAAWRMDALRSSALIVSPLMDLMGWKRFVNCTVQTPVCGPHPGIPPCRRTRLRSWSCCRTSRTA